MTFLEFMYFKILHNKIKNHIINNKDAEFQGESFKIDEDMNF